VDTAARAKNEPVSGRVRIGTCANPADAAFVRSVFAARGIEVVIAAEHHASLLGSIGSNFLSLDIWVDGDDADDATALLRDLREGVAGDAAGDAAADPAAPAPDSDDDDDDGPDDVRARTFRRRRTGVAILLGCCVTFGTAHMVTGAWRRGIALAVLEFVGLLQILRGRGLGAPLVIAAIACDVIGALLRVHMASRTSLPIARVRRS